MSRRQRLMMWAALTAINAIVVALLIARAGKPRSLARTEGKDLRSVSVALRVPNGFGGRR